MLGVEVGETRVGDGDGEGEGDGDEQGSALRLREGRRGSSSFDLSHSLVVVDVREGKWTGSILLILNQKLRQLLKLGSYK